MTFIRSLLAAACWVTSGAVCAAPYAITYTGTVANSGISGIHNGQRYTVTLVMDNGSNNAVNQSWGIQHLTCALWRINDSADVRVGWPVLHAQGQGQARTDATGALTRMFNSVVHQSSVPFEAVGLPFGTLSVEWFLNYNTRFQRNEAEQFADELRNGSVLLAANWSAPAPYDGNCSVDPPPQPGISSVPTLGTPALALLALGALGLARRRLRVSDRTNHGMQ